MAVVTPEIVGRNFEVTPDIRQLIESKLDRVEDRLFDDVISVRVVLNVEKYRNICETLSVGKEHDVRAVQESQPWMRDAINPTIDPVKPRAKKTREKTRDPHRHDGAAPA